MIDLHVHGLPGVDDGPEDLEAAVTLLRQAEADGIEAVVVTPHQLHPYWGNDDRPAIEALFAELRRAVGETPRLELGGEIHVGSEVLAEVDRLPGGSLLPLAGSRYLLLEFPGYAPWTDPRGLVHEVVVAGFTPVLAHPERVPPWTDEPLALAELVEVGALLQLTAMSITGEFGRKAQRCSAALIDAGLAHFIASDAHGPSRPALLSRAFATVADTWGEDEAHRLFVANPAAVLADRPLA
jgi:protein-tyrosine phosphatase